MKKLYLAGPITETDDPATWRVTVANQLPEPWQAVDPIKMEITGQPSWEIVETDLHAISQCDALLALADEPSWGTAMEIFYATHQPQIPVIAWRPKNHRPPSPWLREHSRYIVNDWGAVKAILGALNNGTDSETN